MSSHNDITIVNGVNTKYINDDIAVDQIESLNLLRLVYQVAGQTRLLQTKDGRLVLKPIERQACGQVDQREHNFYRRIFNTNQSCLNKYEKELTSFLPAYRGSCIYNGVTYIITDNIAYGFRYPTVIDFKIRESTERSEFDNSSVGFQLSGMKIFEKADIAFYYYDKYFGRGLNKADIIHSIALFFQCHQTLQINKIKQTIVYLENMQTWFQRQGMYQFNGSSVIISYDAVGDPNTSSVRVSLVDFVNVCSSKDSVRDETFLYGLSSLIDCLKAILSPEYIFDDIRYKN